ncbi:MAG: indole-3-glycerol phosphate synthase TrpC [Candidatus Omnitrophica bacterium]|nr:indole-3-glycerol phosphate synthase TrpC [Candidatus Omnitrophota bacterium]
MKNDTLKEILLKKKERLLLAKQKLPEEELRAKVSVLKPTRSFSAVINKPRQISLIAEIKQASPSRGIIRQEFNPVEIARIYVASGAQAISVLTEEDFFYGNIGYLKEIKDIVDIPLLRKDFIWEPYQVYESRYFGADAILLIAEILSQEKIIELWEIATALGMECLVEVHTEKELKKVLKLKKLSLIGINNRNLHTLEIDFKTTQNLFPLIPKDKTVVVESGIKSHQDVLFLKILGVNAVLIGEALMEAEDIRKRIVELMGW